MKKKLSSITFILVLLSVSFFYNYHHIAFKRPESLHKWRQCDCASIALNYYQHGMNFFKPQTHNLESDYGKSGRCYTSEVPILYFSVAILYKIFGYHDYIYRIFNTLLFLLGIFFLFRIMMLLTDDWIWATLTTLIVFTSPVLVFYGNNFLSNSDAFSFSIIGWYYYIRYSLEKKYKLFIIAIFIFLLSAAFKVTAFFSLIAIMAFHFLQYFKASSLEIKKIKKMFIPIMIAIAIIGSWILFAKMYNEKHHCVYFSTTIFPIWHYSYGEAIEIIKNIYRNWGNQYFHFSIYIVLFCCTIILLLRYKKSNQIFLISILSIICFEIIYFLLQFWTFMYHDYYAIDMFILPVLILVATIELLKREYSVFFKSYLVKIALTILVLFNVQNAKSKLQDRYEGWMNNYSQTSDFYRMTPYLRSIGISEFDTVVVTSDGNPCNLYLLNQKGWTAYSYTDPNEDLKLPNAEIRLAIKRTMRNSAQYLILDGAQQLFNNPDLIPYCTNLKGRFNNALIFDLKHKRVNFKFNNRQIIRRIFCDAESLSYDNQHFISRMDSSVYFGDGSTQSNDCKHGGKFSSKLFNENPYGMTTLLKELKRGESIEVNVWRKSVDLTKGSLVISSRSSNKFHFSEYKVFDKSDDGWERIHMDFFVAKDNQDIVVFAYNPDKEPVYFDDLEITHYKSFLTK